MLDLPLALRRIRKRVRLSFRAAQRFLRGPQEAPAPRRRYDGAPPPPRSFALDAEAPVDIGCIKVFRAENFPNAGPVPWLDRDDADVALERAAAAREIEPHEADLCRKWIRDGYVVLEGCFDPAMLDAAWSAYEADIQSGRIKVDVASPGDIDPHPGRFLNPHFYVAELDGLLRHPSLTRVCDLLLGRRAIPFQTITSHKGSQQGAHSDSIHMTTYPVGYLVACWIAMEDIHADSGPLVYYPGSHRAPYVFSNDVGITFDDFKRAGYQGYHDRYEPAIQQVVSDGKYPERRFLAKKGDVLFWHANLVHGGSPRLDLSHSRKAVVCHYYAEGCVCYHDLSGTPSLVHGPVEKLPVCGAYGNS